MPVEHLHDATTLAEFVEMLKAEHGDSYQSLSRKIGVSHSTLHRVVKGQKADDETLDKIADYAGVTRAWLYELAKGVPVRPRYSRTVSLIASLLEQLPIEIQESFLIQARSYAESLKKRRAKTDQ